MSREHAEMSREGNSFYLRDLDSKFGTMSLVQKPILVH
jgi:pSer/pThr/pTyr-binding forkhead associated (FHA) protein